jgi:predicted amidohydrolase YtcJ
MARLGVRAGVHPAHLLDDRDVAERCWPDRTDRCFALRAMADAGVVLTMGSDAPVSPLDPWLAMAAAVHRSADERAPWHPEQSLTPGEALAASTDGQGTLAVGSRGDIVLLDDDPLEAGADPAEAAGRLRRMRVAATFVAGRPTYMAL